MNDPDPMPDARLEQVRDLLFGDQLRAVARTLDALEERLSAADEGLRQRLAELDARLSALDGFAREVERRLVNLGDASAQREDLASLMEGLASRLRRADEESAG